MSLVYFLQDVEFLLLSVQKDLGLFALPLVALVDEFQLLCLVQFELFVLLPLIFAQLLQIVHLHFSEFQEFFVFDHSEEKLIHLHLDKEQHQEQQQDSEYWFK
jgi:hypothetical protein